MRSANSCQVESSYVIRLQAQLCRAMHSLGVMESQLALVKENCSSLIKFMKEDLSHMVDDRTRREIELMNGLAKVDNEKRVMAEDMKAKMTEKEELLDQVREEYEELGLEYDENEVKRALEVKYLLEQTEKVKEDKARLEKELLAALLEREEQINRLKVETTDLTTKLDGLRKESEEREMNYRTSPQKQMIVDAEERRKTATGDAKNNIVPVVASQLENGSIDEMPETKEETKPTPVDEAVCANDKEEATTHNDGDESPSGPTQQETTEEEEVEAPKPAVVVDEATATREESNPKPVDEAACANNKEEATTHIDGDEPSSGPTQQETTEEEEVEAPKPAVLVDQAPVTTDESKPKLVDEATSAKDKENEETNTNNNGDEPDSDISQQETTTNDREVQANDDEEESKRADNDLRKEGTAQQQELPIKENDKEMETTDDNITITEKVDAFESQIDNKSEDTPTSANLGNGDNVLESEQSQEGNSEEVP